MWPTNDTHTNLKSKNSLGWKFWNFKTVEEFWFNFSRRIQMRTTNKKSLFAWRASGVSSVPFKCCCQLKCFSCVREVAALTKPALAFCISILSKILQWVNMSIQQRSTRRQWKLFPSRSVMINKSFLKKQIALLNTERLVQTSYRDDSSPFVYFLWQFRGKKDVGTHTFCKLQVFCANNVIFEHIGISHSNCCNWSNL